MSAIGSVVVLKRQDFAPCVQLAGLVRSEHKGWGPFKKLVTHGLSSFEQAWHAAVVDELDFDFSGYVLGDYLYVQQEMSGLDLDHLGAAEAGRTLGKVFTAAFPFEQPQSLPELPLQPLREFCVTQWEADAEGMFTALQAADRFYRAGLERLSAEHMVVFLIS